MRRISTYLFGATVLAALLASFGIGQQPGQVPGPQYSKYKECTDNCSRFIQVSKTQEDILLYNKCVRQCGEQFPEAFVTPLRSMRANVVQLGTDGNGPTVKPWPQSGKRHSWSVGKAADTVT